MSANYNSKPSTLMKGLKLLFGALGIYGAFGYYGVLQEAIFSSDIKDTSSPKFNGVWFLQFLEALSNVLISLVGLLVLGMSSGVKMRSLLEAGVTQVFAKAFTNLALENKVSFPIVTLAKSGKMIPVMAGSLIFGNASYTIEVYLTVLCIIIGTSIVSMGKKSHGGDSSSYMGLAFIALSLICDGITGGKQKQFQDVNKDAKGKATYNSYDMMFYTNLTMSIVALVVSFANRGEFLNSLAFCQQHPEVLSKIGRFCLCSAIGQSFVFFIISEFDSLTVTTVTTTRKVFSVLLSIFLNGHKMEQLQWFGLGLACAAILFEIYQKSAHDGKKKHGISAPAAVVADDSKKSSTTTTAAAAVVTNNRATTRSQSPKKAR